MQPYWDPAAAPLLPQPLPEPGCCTAPLLPGKSNPRFRQMLLLLSQQGALPMLENVNVSQYAVLVTDLIHGEKVAHGRTGTGVLAAATSLVNELWCSAHGSPRKSDSRGRLSTMGSGNMNSQVPRIAHRRTRSEADGQHMARMASKAVLMGPPPLEGEARVGEALPPADGAGPHGGRSHRRGTSLMPRFQSVLEQAPEALSTASVNLEGLRPGGVGEASAAPRRALFGQMSGNSGGGGILAGRSSGVGSNPGGAAAAAAAMVPGPATLPISVLAGRTPATSSSLLGTSSNGTSNSTGSLITLPTHTTPGLPPRPMRPAQPPPPLAPPPPAPVPSRPHVRTRSDAGLPDLELSTSSSRPLVQYDRNPAFIGTSDRGPGRGGTPPPTPSKAPAAPDSALSAFFWPPEHASAPEAAEGTSSGGGDFSLGALWPGASSGGASSSGAGQSSSGALPAITPIRVTPKQQVRGWWCLMQERPETAARCLYFNTLCAQYAHTSALLRCP